MPALEERTPQPMFDQPVTGVSRRRATLPSVEEVAPVVVAYLRQVGGEPLSPHEIEALLPAPAPAPAPRSRETMLLVGLAVLLFLAAFAVAFALLPRALS